MADNNTGVDNSGNWNSGNWNSGDWNSGNRNSGDWNSGNRNSGDRNSGDWNSGNRNSGDRNSGYLNSGDWNSGNRNSGYLNSTEPTVRLFNLDTGKTYEEIEKFIPSYFYSIILTEWVGEDDMSEQEKKDNPSYGVTEGYLKVYEYKEAWKNAWDKAEQEDKEKTLKLPNWNNEVFLEITGIDVEKELNTPVVKDDKMEEAMKLLKENGYKITKD